MHYFLETFIWSYVGPWLLLLILYLGTLHKTLRACRPENRVMPPWMVWLQVLPCVIFVWQFVNVIAVGGSLGREFRSRGVAELSPLERLGLAMCGLMTLGFIAAVMSDAGTGLGDPASVSRWWTVLSWFGDAIRFIGVLAAIVYWTGVITKRDELQALDRAEPGTPVDGPVASAG